MRPLRRRSRTILAVVLRLLALSALFFGLGALGAAILIPSSEGEADWAWLDRARAIAWWVAATWVPGAGLSLFLSPSQTRLTHDDPGHPGPALPSWLRPLLLGILAGTILLFLPLALWWQESLDLLVRLVGPGLDPSGLQAIPGAILVWLPAGATVAAISGGVGAALGCLAPGPRLPRLLWSCTSLTAGLSIGSAIALNRMLELAAWIAPRLAGQSDTAAAAAELSAWAARQASTGGLCVLGQLCLLGGLLAASISATWLTPAPRPLEGRDRGAAPPGPAPRPAPSEAARRFDRSTFVVKPRVSLLSLLRKRHTEYDLWGYGDARGGRIDFSFSWATGLLQSEPDGHPILTTRARAAGLVASEYDVTCAASGAILATIRSDGPEWELFGPGGGLMACVSPSGTRRHQYVARAADLEIARYLWAGGSWGALNPELEIELEDGAGDRVDRAALIALGPLLEHQARRSVRTF